MTKEIPDSPKVHVEFKSPYGEGTQQLPIQSNRTDPSEQFSWKWLNRLYPPSDWEDFTIDAATYIITAGLLVAVVRPFIDLLYQPVVLLLVFAIVSGISFLSWFICKDVKRGWVLLTYRAVLVTIGVVIGGVL